MAPMSAAHVWTCGKDPDSPHLQSVKAPQPKAISVIVPSHSSKELQQDALNHSTYYHKILKHVEQQFLQSSSHISGAAVSDVEVSLWVASTMHLGPEDATSRGLGEAKEA